MAGVWCPAGLLCEADAPVQGWRVPAACRVTQRGRYGASCELVGVGMNAVAEFYRSRYPEAVTVELGTLRVEGQAPPLMTPPRLRGLDDGQTVTLRLMSGDKSPTRRGK